MDGAEELYVTEHVKGEDRHWIFKLKGRSRKATLDRYWARRFDGESYVSTGWYRSSTAGRTLEIKDIPRPENMNNLVEWCRHHETDVPKFGKAPPKEVSSVRARNAKPKTVRPRGRPPGAVNKTSTSHKIRRELARNPDIPTADLIKKHGVSRQLVSLLRKSLKADE